MTRIIPLETGADARVRNEGAPLAAVLANGGTARPLPGTWSATSELLASELAPRFGEIELIELRYRVKTWNQLESCMADVVAALELAWRNGARECLLVGFSMGGAVSIGVAGHDAAAAVLGLAPWIPDRLPLDGLRGKRFDVIHGAWDRFLPGIPGVSPDNSRRGYERARAIGVEGTYTLIPRGLHGAAVRSPFGDILRLPGWRRWVALVGEGLERFQASASAASLRRSS